MDPNATLERLKWALMDLEAHPSTSYREELEGEITQFCEDLFHWIASGGFQPDWHSHPKAAGYYLTWTTRH